MRNRSEKSLEEWEQEIEVIEDSGTVKQSPIPLKITGFSFESYRMYILHFTIISGLFIIFSRYELYNFWVIFTGVYLVYLGLNASETKEKEVQAAPIKQKKYKTLQSHKHIKKAHEFDDSDTEEDKRNLYWVRKSKYSNSECYCGSSVKYKKCCLPVDREFFASLSKKNKDEIKELL